MQLSERSIDRCTLDALLAPCVVTARILSDHGSHRSDASSTASGFASPHSARSSNPSRRRAGSSLNRWACPCQHLSTYPRKQNARVFRVGNIRAYLADLSPARKPLHPCVLEGSCQKRRSFVRALRLVELADTFKQGRESAGPLATAFGAATALLTSPSYLLSYAMAHLFFWFLHIFHFWGLVGMFCTRVDGPAEGKSTSVSRSLEARSPHRMG